MKVLVLAPCPFPAPRGSQVFIAGTAAGLAARGHDVTLACYANGEGEPPTGVSLLRAGPVPGAYSGSGPHPSKLLANLRLARVVRRWCRTHRPDAVLAHNVEAPLVARMAGVDAPVVWEAHTRMAEELPMYLPRSGVLGEGLDLAAAAASDAAIALSDPGAAWLRGLGLPTRTVPPAVRVEDLRGIDRAAARARLGLDARPWVVYAGNADPYQELPLLFAAVAALPEVGLLLAAPGAHSMARDLPDQRVVRVDSARFVDHRNALAAADIAALPRGRCAGFPIKLLNHAALGLPTVAAGDSARPVPGTVAVGPGDVAGFAGALSALAADADLRERLGAAARQAALARSWDRRAAALESAIRSWV